MTFCRSSCINNFLSKTSFHFAKKIYWSKLRFLHVYIRKSTRSNLNGLNLWEKFNSDKKLVISFDILLDSFKWESLHTLLLLDFSVLLLLKQTYNSERDSLRRVYKKSMDIKDAKNRLKRCCEIQMWAPSCGAHLPKNKLCFLYRSDNIFWVTLFVSLILGKFSVLELICKIFSEFEKIKKSNLLINVD